MTINASAMLPHRAESVPFRQQECHAFNLIRWIALSGVLGCTLSERCVLDATLFPSECYWYSFVTHRS